MPKESTPLTTSTTETPSVVLIRLPEVQQMIGLSRTTIWRAVRSGTFPSPLRVSQNAVAWRRDEIQTWIQQRPRTVIGGRQ